MYTVKIFEILLNMIFKLKQSINYISKNIIGLQKILNTRLQKLKVPKVLSTKCWINTVHHKVAVFIKIPTQCLITCTANSITIIRKKFQGILALLTVNISLTSSGVKPLQNDNFFIYFLKCCDYLVLKLVQLSLSW